jgi:hypothetical protein
MNLKAINLLLISSILLFGSYGYNGSTTSAVTLVGGIIKSQSVEVNKKYKRKDCPICEGKGWYISGDGIKKVDCGYCEPDKKQIPQKVVVHPPAVMKQDCPNGVCPMPSNKVIK